MYCQECGNKLNEGSKFCDKCGAQQGAHTVATTPEKQFVKTTKNIFSKIRAGAIINIIAFAVHIVILVLVFSAGVQLPIKASDNFGVAISEIQGLQYILTPLLIGGLSIFLLKLKEENYKKVIVVIVLVLSILNGILSVTMFRGSLICCFIWFALLIPLMQIVGSIMSVLGIFAYEKYTE